MKMKIVIVKSEAELKDAYPIRGTVFIEEQKVEPEIEHDEFDETAIHFVGYADDKAVAAGRLRWVDGYGKLERLCVLKEYRGKSYGQQMILAMEEVIAEHSYQEAKLNAQSHAEQFYVKLGYETVSDEFYDAGIPHVTMTKKLSSSVK